MSLDGNLSVYPVSLLGWTTAYFWCEVTQVASTRNETDQS